MSIQVKLISSTSLNDEVHYYSIEVNPHDDTSSPVQDSTISTTTKENEEEQVIENINLNHAIIDRIIREADQLLMELNARI